MGGGMDGWRCAHKLTFMSELAKYLQHQSQNCVSVGVRSCDGSSEDSSSSSPNSCVRV